ncbi:MAG: GntR family transcriptional regulator [Lachnospiraceae bacterium]|nr:GntR family transcriptional regulator [Lachnospiraceae bacterium]
MSKQLKYLNIIEDLRNAIFNGEIRPGDKLPSENVLSEKYSVSRQTVRKALEVLTDEGYVYAEHGRGTFCSHMIKHRTGGHNIAVITTYLSDYIFPRVIQGIDDVLTENGYSILLKNTNNSRTREAAVLEELIKKDIDGLIIEPSKSQIFCRHINLYKMLDEYNIPYVFIQGSYSQLKDKPTIVLNDEKGGFIVTDHLIEQGYRDIVGVFKADDIQGLERHKGYIKALQKAGIPYDPDKVIWYHTEDRKSHPFELIKQMIKNRDELYFDSIVAYNDQVAIQLLKGIEQMGLSCPDDIALTGYDNSYLAASCKVPLTTITHPQEKLGAMAADMLLKLINGEIDGEKEKLHMVIEPELIVRESCKKKQK